MKRPYRLSIWLSRCVPTIYCALTDEQEAALQQWLTKAMPRHCTLEPCTGDVATLLSDHDAVLFLDMAWFGERATHILFLVSDPREQARQLEEERERLHTLTREYFARVNKLTHSSV